MENNRWEDGSAAIEEGDIIFCTRSRDIFAGCLMFVDEVKSWGVQAGMVLPDGSATYVRFNNSEFIRMTDPFYRRKMYLGEDRNGEY